MAWRRGILGVLVNVVFLGAMSFLSLWPSAVRAEDSDLSALVSRVDPCVVTLTSSFSHSMGSGFVVDASGLIATNYHVIEGSVEQRVIFPDKSSYLVLKYLAYSVENDLALLRVEPAGKQLRALKFAAKPPAKGEKVFAFGAPLGMSGSVSDGIVAAIRTGEEVRDILREGSSKDIYRDILGYDTDMQWIQTTTPISPGNSGGPLVNAKGEVIAINTWQNRMGQNINFAVDAGHLQKLIANAGTRERPLVMLPRPRIHTSNDNDQTLVVWKQLNRLVNGLTAKIADCDKKLATLKPPAGRSSLSTTATRLKKRGAIYQTLSQAYSDFAAKVKALKTADIDPEFVKLSISEADLAQRIGDICEQIVKCATPQSEAEMVAREIGLQEQLPEATANLRTHHDVIRAALSLKYHKDFPTLQQTAAEPPEEANETAKDGPKSSASVAAESSSPHAAMRTWTDSTGTHHVEAKLQGMKDGKVTLERADGSVVTLPVEKLCPADRHFLGADKE